MTLKLLLLFTQRNAREKKKKHTFFSYLLLKAKITNQLQSFFYIFWTGSSAFRGNLINYGRKKLADNVTEPVKRRAEKKPWHFMRNTWKWVKRRWKSYKDSIFATFCTFHFRPEHISCAQKKKIHLELLKMSFCWRRNARVCLRKTISHQTSGKKTKKKQLILLHMKQKTAKTSKNTLSIIFFSNRRILKES